jgi:hypothetical protein
MDPQQLTMLSGGGLCAAHMYAFDLYREEA